MSENRVVTSTWKSLVCGGGLVIAGLATSPVLAGCPCKSGGSVAPQMLAPSPEPVLMSPGSPSATPDLWMSPGPMPYAAAMAPRSAPIAAPVGDAVPGTNRFGVLPPPGTLGRTYEQRSTLIPDDKHPRVGMVDVHLPEDVDVVARGMKSKWTGEVWRLESEQPLIPGVTHIYAIRAEKTLPDGTKDVQVRWVRLIMGRIVDLKF